MAQDDKIISAILKYIVDIPSANRAILTSAKVRGSMEYIATAAKQVSVAAPKMSDAIIKSADDSSKRLVRLKSAYSDITKAAQEAGKAADDAAKRQQTLTNLDLLTTRTERGLSGVGLKGVGKEVVGGVGDLAQLIVDLPKLKEAFAGLPDAAKSAVQTIGAGGVGLIGAIGALAVVLSLAQQQFQAVKAAASAGLDSRQQALNLLLTASKEEVRARIVELEEKKKVNQAIADDANKVLGALRTGIANDPTIKLLLGRDLATGITEFGAVLGIGAGELAAAKEAADAANAALNETSVEFNILTQGVNGMSDAASKAALEIARATNAIAADTARVNAQIEAANLAATGTEKQVQDRLESLAREQVVLTNNLPIMKANLAQATEGSEAQKAFQAQVDNTQKRLSELSTTVMTLAGDTLVAAKENDKAAEAERKRVESIKAVAKFNEDVVKIEEQNAQKQIDLATKYADKQVEIAAKAVEDAEKLLAGLEQKLADLSTDLGRDLSGDTRKANFEQAQALVEFQRDELASTQKHYQDLQRIQRAARANEFEQGLSRDFAGLASSRRQTAEQISEANIAFNEDRQARLDAFSAKRTDEAAEFLFERSERLLQFEQDIADARAQFVRERQQQLDASNKALIAARTAYTKELSQLQSKYNAELSARNAAAVAELQMIANGNTAKLQLEAQYIQQSLNLLRSAMNSVSGSASGGSSAASSGFTSSGGSTGSVSGSGSLGGIGGIFGFGASAQTKSGNQNSLSMSMPINITTGGSPEQVKALVPAIRKTVDEALTTYHRAVYGR